MGGRVAVVTGAGGGIGRAAATAFARCGARVARGGIVRTGSAPAHRGSSKR